MPGAVSANTVTGHDGGTVALLQDPGNPSYRIRVRGRPGRYGTYLHGLHLCLPVVHRYGKEDRTLRLLGCDVAGAGDGRRHVFGPGRLVAPLHVRFRKLRELAVQQRLQREVAPVLLAGGDDERGPGVVGVDHHPHRVAEAGGRVEVDEGGATRGLGVAVSHREDRGFLKAEDVVEVVREVLQERQLGRARVAEDRGHT